MRPRDVVALVSLVLICGNVEAWAAAEEAEISGKLVLRCNDCFNPDHQGPKHTPFIREKNSFQLVELKMAEKDIPRDKVGKQVKVRGKLNRAHGQPDKRTVDEVSLIEQIAAADETPGTGEIAASGKSGTGPVVASASPVTAERKCLLIFANASDWTYPEGDKTAIADAMVNNSRNVDQCYRAVSRGHAGIVLGKDTNDAGMVTVNINKAANTDWGGMEGAMIAEAALLGFNESDYDHVLCFVPSGASLWAPAYANVPGVRSTYSWGRRKHLETITHELGHNLGFYHSNEWNHQSSTSQEYGDNTCVMGPSPNSGNSCTFNPPKQDFRGWFDFHTGSLQKPTTDVTLSIPPYALSLDTDPGTRSVKFQGELYSGTNYYQYYTAYLKNMDPYGLVPKAEDKDKLIIYKGLFYTFGVTSDQWQNLDPGQSYTVNGVEVTFEIMGDSTGSYAIASFDFADGNAKPVADAQSVTTKLNNAKSITLTGSDADLESFTIALATSPSNGVLSGTVPNLTYTPNTNYIGSDAFAFYVDDGKVRSYAWVSIDVTAPQVSVAATDPNASEAGPDDGVWTFTRTGDTSEALDLAFSLSGTANLSGDYSLSSSSPLTLPAGQTNVTLTLTPVDDSLFLEHSETAVLTLAAGVNYIVGNVSDTITITDNDNNAPVVNAGEDQIAVVDPDAEWTPAHRPTAAWFDASDTNTITLNGGNVSDWLDKSGNGNHAVQATGSAQPLYKASDALLNNMGTIYSASSGSGAFLSAPSMGAKRIYGIMYYGDGTATPFDNHNAVISGPGSSGQYRLTGGSGGTKWETSNAFCDDTIWKNGDDSVDAKTGILPMPATMWVFNSTAERTQTWRILAGNSTAWSCWIGGLGELIFTDGTESTGDRQKFEGYLAHKWGLEGSLPTNHPYKSEFPTGSSATVNLDGTVTDADGETPSVVWSLQSGPDSVFFGDAYAVDTTVILPSVGVYVMRLTADDGSAVVYDEITVTVSGSMIPLVSVTATDGTASETGPDGGEWTVSRTGVTTSSLDVVFSLGGTATLGADYNADSTNLVTIPVGQSSVTVTLTPVDDSVTNEAVETAVLSITAQGTYAIGANDALISITDNDTPSYTLTYLAGLNGGISGTSTQSVFQNNDGALVTAVPDTGYMFDQWSDGLLTATRTDTNVNNDITVTASFVLDPLIVVSRGAAASNTTTASISAEITGGGSGAAWLCWGDNDAGSGTTNDWDNVVAMGTVSESNLFSHLVTGLAANASYWYRCYVSNGVTDDWTDSATSFSGAPVNAAGPASASSVVAVAEVFCHNEKVNVSGYPGDMIWGTGMNGNPDNYAGSWPTNHPSLWTATDSGYRSEWQSMGLLNPATSLNGKIGWAIFDLGTAQQLEEFYMWNVRENAGRYTATFNVYVAEVPTVTPIHGPTDTTSIDYDFTGGGWTKVNGPVLTGTFRGSQVISLGSASARYVAVEILSNNGDVSRVGLAEAGIVAAVSEGSSVANMAPSDISAGSASLSAALDASGKNYDVYAHWGASDGGSNAASWAESAYVGSWTNVSTNLSYIVSGLSAGQACFYTFRASNDTENVWAAPSWQFSTLPGGPGPQVTTNHSVPHAWLDSINGSWSNDYETAVMDDPDGDGFTTWQEYWCGTDPEDVDSYFRIESIVSTATNVVIKWKHAKVDPSIPAVTIEACTNLAVGAWSVVGTISPSNGTNSWAAGAPSRQFYRLVAAGAQ